MSLTDHYGFLKHSFWLKGLPVLLFLFATVPFHLFAQTEMIEILKARLKTAENEEKANALILLCRAYRQIDGQISTEYGRQAISYSQEINYKQGYISGNFDLASALHLNDRIEESLIHYNISLTEYRNMNHPQGISSCLTNIGNAYYDIGEYEKARLAYEESLQWQKNLNDDDGIARTYNNLGNLYTDWGNTSKGLEYNFLSLQIRETMNDSILVSYSLNSIGRTYFMSGNREKGLHYYLQSLVLKEKFADKRGIATTLNNIAAIYSDLGRVNLAIEYHAKALSIFTELKEKRGTSATMQILADLYKRLAEFEKAEQYYRHSLAIKLEIDEKIGIALVRNGLAKILQARKQYGEAEKEFLLAIQLQQELSDFKNLALSFYHLALLYQETGSLTKAKDYFSQAIQIAKQTDSPPVLRDAYQKIAETYYQTQDFKNALSYLEQYVAIKDSLFNEAGSKILAEMTTKFETEQKEKEIRFLTTEQEKNRLIRNYLLVFSFFVLIIATLLYFLYLTKTKENKQRRASEAKIKELNRTLEARVKEEVAKLEKQQILLMQKSKLESLGRLSAGIAHEINQPVTRLSLGLDNVLIRQSMGKLDDSYLSQKCKDLFSDIDRIRVIIDHVRTFSREQSRASLEKINPNSVIENAIMLVQTQFKNHQVKLNKELDENIGFTLGNAFQLEQVMMNLLSNAKDAVEEKAPTISNYEKEIFVKTYQQENRIYLEVRDNGIGISEEAIAKIFDPFYTTKSAEKGTGLGLSISYGIIKEMNGDIEVESKDGEFTLMRILLPGS